MFYFKHYFIVVIFGLFNSVSSSKSGVLVAAPKYLLADSKEKICVSFHNRSNNTPVNIILLNINSNEIITSSQDFVKGNASCLTFYIPPTDETHAKLQVRFPASAENDIPYFSEQNVEIKQDPLITIIALEKPIYRPGEVVRFRILSLTHKLKVFKNKFHKVWIESPNGIKLEQWLNVKTDRGLAQLEFPLSEEGLLGEWRIKVQINNKNDLTEEKTFTIKEYILPHFEVKIKQPKEILADAEIVDFEICAKYNYGAAVKGNVKLELEAKLIFPSSVLQPKIILETKLDQWTGCSVLNATGEELLIANPEVTMDKLKVTATVTEIASRKSEKLTTEFDVLNSAVKLEFHCSEYFKPGLPYKGKVRVLSPDGQPTGAVDLPIQICMKEGGFYESIYSHCWNYSTDFSSELVFTLPPRPNSTNLITLTAISLRHPNKFYENKQWSWKLLMIQPKATQHLKPWYSPSKSYIEISTVSPVICNSEHTLHVQYTVTSFNDATPTFYYLVESRGDLLHSGSMKPDSEKELTGKVLVGFPPARAFTLRISITHDMAPESRIAIYYVRSDGEIIAASTVLIVDKCFPNKVKARWSETEVQPGANVSLSVRAHSSSLCAINVIDSMITKSNYKKKFLRDIIWEKLDYYKIPFLKDTTDYCKLPTVNDNWPSLPSNGDDEELRRRRRRRRVKRMFLLPSVFENVDAITAFNDIGVVVLTDLTLETRQCPNYSNSFFDYRLDNGVPRAGFYLPLPLASNVVSKPVINNKNEKVNLRNPKSYRENIRSFFPEAWLWSIVNVEDDGLVTLETSAPHSVTSWDTNVFCINDEVGFGMSDTISLVTFLPFFLTVNTPKSFIRTEALPVNVTIYNYLGHSLPVQVSFYASAGLETVGLHHITHCVSELSPESFNFTITATDIGLFNITVSAEVLPALDNCNPAVYQGVKDTVVKPIKVLAEGFQITNSYSALFCANDALKSPWNLSLPNNIINNTARAIVTISPGLLGPALQGLGDFLEIPTGCGEQNMIRLAPIIHILRYMNIMNIVNSEMLKEKAINNIKKGYQRQLQYRHPDGSYSAFGPKNMMENEGSSIWLTAFVINSFGQALNIISIDNQSLQETLNWIVSKQLENGCFPLIGLIYSKDIKGGLQETESTAALTAYIVSSLYKSGLHIPPSVSSNAEFCLSAERNVSDVYNLALITYAFTIINSNSHKALHNLNKLVQMAQHDQDFIWWEKPGGSLALNIEITGYAILSLLKKGGSDNIVTAQAAVRWLSTNRNYKGGFVSTQDTVIGLEALTTFAMAVPSSNVTSLFVSVVENGNNILDKHTFMIENNNRDLQQHVTIKNLPSTLMVHSRGEGCALVQTTLKYNIGEKMKDDSAFDVSVFTHPLASVDECYFQEIEICLQNKYGVSNMIIIVINFVTGYSPDRDSLSGIVGIQRWEEDEEENKLIVYLEKVLPTLKCFHFTLERTHPINNAAPAVVTVTDYYHPERTKSVNYSIVCDENLTGMLLDSPSHLISQQNFENFKNVDFELSVPDGVEGPKPSYSCPDSNVNCQLPVHSSHQPSPAVV